MTTKLSTVRNAVRPRIVSSACALAPITPTVDAPDGASTSVANAAASPVRQAVIVAESIKARSAPSVKSWRQTTPRKAGEASGNFSFTFTV